MEIMETRLALEPRLAGLAVLRATAAEIAEMRRSVEKSKSAIDIRTYELWDATLHRTIAEAAHNNLLLSMFNALNALREDKVWGQLKNATVTTERKVPLLNPAPGDHRGHRGPRRGRGRTPHAPPPGNRARRPVLGRPAAQT